MSTEHTVNPGRVLIVGGGSMGSAICAGLVASGMVGASDLCVANPGSEKRALLEEQYDIATVSDARDALPVDLIVLAVKPGIVADVAAGLAKAGIGDAKVVSIAAGVSTTSLERIFGDTTEVVRVMPNTPLLCGHGMSAVSAGSVASDQTCEMVRSIFAGMGHAVIVDEDKQDIVTAVSGSGPAYFELFLETIARSAQGLGLDYETSLELALQTMYGTAALIDETGQDLEEAIAAVSSPGGTTVAALDAMRESGLQEALENGVKAATQRSKELGL